MDIGWHASHEQFGPDDLLRYATLAEECGFHAVLSSDHFAPWSTSHAESGFSLAWLGAAMARTTLPYAVVLAPTGRYHPAVIAQAIATLDRMFPGRLTCALGSGEALNEHITGEPWPAKPEREARLDAAASAILRMLDGDEVDTTTPVMIDRARLHTRPATRPQVFAAALTPESAARVGAWAHGLITVNAPVDTLSPVIEAFRSSAGPHAPCHVQMHVSWADDEAEARQSAVDNWRVNALTPQETQDIATPEDFDAATQHVTAADLEDSVVMFSRFEVLRDRLKELDELGVERTYLHHVGRDQERFLRTLGPAMAEW